MLVLKLLDESPNLAAVCNKVFSLRLDEGYSWAERSRLWEVCNQDRSGAFSCEDTFFAL